MASIRETSQERYIAAKQRWAVKQKIAGVTTRVTVSADQLQPGQKLTTGFPVLVLSVRPDIPRSEWTLGLDGLVANPTTLSWAAFNAPARSNS